MSFLSYLEKHELTNSPILKDFYDICMQYSESFRVLNELFETGEKALEELKPQMSEVEDKGNFQYLSKYFRSTDIESRHKLIFRNGLYLSLYANTEDLIIRYCRIFEESIVIGSSVNVDTSILLKELNGKGIERAMLFLRKIVRVDVEPSFTRVFPLIRDIRNSIAHQNGTLSIEKLGAIKNLQRQLCDSIPNSDYMDVIGEYAKILTNDFTISKTSNQVSKIVLLPKFNNNVSTIFQIMIQLLIPQLEKKLINLVEGSVEID